MKKTLSNKELKEINNEISKYDFQFNKKDIITVDDKCIKLKNDVMFFYIGEELIPTIKLALKNEVSIKKITVDMGAVKFVVNGADIMRPGITNIEDEIEKDEFILIIDENNKKPLAIGKALFNSEEMKGMNFGKVIENLHYVGDEIYNK